MIKILTKRERTILYLTVGIIISSILVKFLIAPVFTKNNNLNQEIKFTRVKLKKYLWLISKKKSLESKFSKYISGLSATAQESDTLVSALAELENLAKAAQIRIIDIRPQAPKASNLYKEIAIDIRAEGTMENYLKFIYDIENSLALLRIKRMQLNSKPNTPLLEGTFSITQLSL